MSAIFREYDIRGIVGDDLTEEVAVGIGLAYGTFLRRSGGKEAVVGRDVRLSSEPLAKALIEGIVKTGCNVLDVGVVPTPVLYFSIMHYEKDGGVMVTGSHNPVEYNGFKLCRGISSLFGDQIQALRKIMEKGGFCEGEGSVEKDNPVPSYIDYVLRRIKVGKRLKVAVDAGNGTAGEIAPEIFRALGCEVIELYCEPDGRFPNHLPDPTVPELMKDLMDTVKKENADVGLGFDGDADRLGAVDEDGNMIYGDKLLALFAKDILKGERLKVVFDVKCSQALAEFIESMGGEPIMWKTGHSLIKAKMKEENAPLGGEMSGHMFFADNYYGYDDAIFAACRLLQLMSNEERSLGGLISEIPRYVSTPEIRVQAAEESKFGIVKQVSEYFRKQYKTVDIDGVRVLFPDGWGLLRASNTQPVLVMRFEAKSEESLEKIKNIFTEKLRTLGVRV